LQKQTKLGEWQGITGNEEIAASAAGLKDGQEVARK